jgi:hypothetical protein
VVDLDLVDELVDELVDAIVTSFFFFFLLFFFGLMFEDASSSLSSSPSFPPSPPPLGIDVISGIDMIVLDGIVLIVVGLYDAFVLMILNDNAISVYTIVIVVILGIVMSLGVWFGGERGKSSC